MISKVTLGEVCDIVSGATPKTEISRFWGGDILWATPKDLSDLETPYLERPSRSISEEGLKSCAARMLPANSVLLSSRAPIGLVAINTVPMATNQGFKSLVPSPKKIDSKFLYHWLRSNTTYLQSLGNGATFKEISKSIVERIEIPLPSLIEQRRIAAILDKADALRRKRKRALELVDGLSQAVFRQMFADGGGTEVKLADLVDPADRINYGVIQPGEPASDGVFLVRAGDLRAGKVDRSNLRTISPQVSNQYSRSVLKGGEILIGCVGSIGEIAIASDEDRGFNIARAVARVPLAEGISRLYVSEYLRTAEVQNYFKSELRTVAQPTLNIKQITETRVMMPTAAQMRSFEKKIGQIHQNNSCLAASDQKLAHMFTSLQHRAFSSEI